MVAPKLSPYEVLEVRALLAQGLSSIAIGRQYNIASSKIRDIRLGNTYKHIHTEADLHKFTANVGVRKETWRVPFIYKPYESLCGFKFTSYALRKYGKKAISLLVDYIEFCEHGEMCEDCCFIYKGPGLRCCKEGKAFDVIILPDSLTGNGMIDLGVMVTEIVFGENPWSTVMNCHNLRCTNIYHMHLQNIGGIRGRTGQKAQSDD